MAYDASKLASLQNLKDVATRIKTEYLSAISKAGHAKFKKAESVPTPETAEENVLYLVKNTKTGYYDIYALIDGSIEHLDDTTVDLEGYVTEDDLKNATSGGSVYTGQKTALDTSDSSVIDAYFAGEGAPTPKKGDVFVINTLVGGVVYEQSAYAYNGEGWVAMTGNVDADKVIMRSNITMAGNYTQVGNKTKDQNGTAEFATEGMSVADVLADIFSKKLQPVITAQPAISGFALTGAKAVEAGTQLASAEYGGATLSAGSYQYGPETGVVVNSWKVQRITNLGTEDVLSMAVPAGTPLSAGADDNDGNGFIIGDAGGDGVVSSMKYKVTAYHGSGVTAHDNLGDDSDPAVAIASGSKSKETAAYTPFRNYFYGATAEKPTVDSAYIRGLTKSGKAYAAGTVTINVPAGAQRVVIACLATKTGVTKVINETAMNADVTSTFVKSVVAVEGSNGYAAQDYNVWVFEPAVAYENAATLKVTLG